MDKNTVTGAVLIGLVLIGFSWWSQPSEAERQEMARQDSIAAVRELQAQEAAEKQQAREQAMQLQAKQDSNSIFFVHRSGTAQTLTLKNEKVSIRLSTQGGTVQEASILGYKNQQKEDVKLLTKGENQLELSLGAKAENINFSDLYFTPSNQTDSTLTLTATAANGGTLSIDYRLRPDSYVLDMVVKANGLENYFAPNTRTMSVHWNDLARQQEKGYTFENQYSTLTYKERKGDTEKLSEVETDEEEVEKPIDWVAFKNQFFSAILIAQQDFTDAKLKSTQLEKGSGYLKQYEADMQTLFDPSGQQATELQMYLGPNNFHILQEVDEQSLGKENLDVEDLVYFGWPIVRWINRFFILYLFDWLSMLGLPMGIVLLLLTIIVKALVYPATRKSYLSSARMRVLKPEVDKLNAKYPKQEDAMKKQQEMMLLYSQYGVSPMGGCLPMLIQMPIWIALFNFVPNAIELRGQSFLWADDLSAYDAIIQWDTELWLIGNHISLFCVLFSLTNIINTMISMKQQQNSMMSPEQEQQMKMMKWMMYIMPVAFFFMFNDYSSGLCYYYFLSGLTSILIMWALRRFTDDDKLLAEMRAYKEKNAGKPQKMNSLAQRLEAMQKMAEEQQRRQQQKK